MTITSSAHTIVDYNFPDEILEAIVVALRDSIPRTDPKFWEVHSATISAWKACSSVSQRWRRITLPYLFRNVNILLPASFLISYLRFFTRAPLIARHVRELKLHDAMVDVYILELLLRALPSLKCLDLDGITVYDSTTPDEQLRCNYALDKVTYGHYYGVPDSQSTSLECLLALFTRIGDFAVRVGKDPGGPLVELTTAHIESAVSRSLVGRTCIQKLRCGGQETSSFFLANFLCEVNAVQSLTALTFRIMEDTDLPAFVRLVQAARTTLQDLCIEINWDIERGAEDYLSAIQKALYHCDALTSFKVIVFLGNCALGKFIRHPLTGRFHIIAQGYEQAWLMAIRVLSHVPLEHLHYVSVNLHGLINDPHALDWGHLKTWCRRVPELKTFDVELQQTHDQRKCFAYEMQGLERVFTPRYVMPMRECRIDASMPEDTPIEMCKCEHQECREYGRLRVVAVDGA